jgi:hypothetical protein
MGPWGKRERAIGPARRMEKGSDAFRAKEALTGREQGENFLDDPVMRDGLRHPTKEEEEEEQLATSTLQSWQIG